MFFKDIYTFFRGSVCPFRKWRVPKSVRSDILAANGYTAVCQYPENMKYMAITKMITWDTPVRIGKYPMNQVVLESVALQIEETISWNGRGVWAISSRVEGEILNETSINS